MIAPYRGVFNPVSVAWLLPDGKNAIHESGATFPVPEIENPRVRIWAGFDTVLSLVKQGKGEALCWEGAPIRWAPKPTNSRWPVRVVRLPTPNTPDECLAGLVEWRDWLASYGATPLGSLGGTALGLLKACLEKPLHTKRGELPPVRFPIGGRQVIGSNGVPFQGEGAFRHWDIRAAYPKTLGHLRYGGRWHRIKFFPSMFQDSEHGTMYYVRCKIRIPDLAVGPLPIRPKTREELFVSLIHPTAYPMNRELQGTWTVAELDAAQQAGCEIVRVLDVWHHASPWFPFLPWWRAIERGREMVGFSSLLAKATGTALWGQFAIRPGRRAALTVHDGQRSLRELKLSGGGNPAQSAPDLTEQICGRVRAELFKGITEAGDRLISAHTDGLWSKDIGKDFTLPGWFSKDSATTLRMLTPQNLAYVRSGEGDTVYVVAGVPSPIAGEWFEKDWRRQCAMQ